MKSNAMNFIKFCGGARFSRYCILMLRLMIIKSAGTVYYDRTLFFIFDGYFLGLFRMAFGTESSQMLKLFCIWLALNNLVHFGISVQPLSDAESVCAPPKADFVDFRCHSKGPEIKIPYPLPLQ